MALNVVVRSGFRIFATEIKATASVMKSFLQLPAGADSLNFTFTVVVVPALKEAAWLGSSVLTRGCWKPQNVPGSAVLVPEFSFTIAKSELLVKCKSPLIGPPRG